MKCDPDKRHRLSIRLKEYDYAQPGAYFVTICTHQRECLFGHVVNGEMHLNEAGGIAQRCWENIPTHFPSVELDAFVIMPNHIHGVIAITEFCRGERFFAPTPSTTTPKSPSRTIGSIVRGFKIGVTKWFREQCRGTLQRAPTQTERFSQPTSNSIPTIVRLFKSATTMRINVLRGPPATPVW